MKIKTFNHNIIIYIITRENNTKNHYSNVFICSGVSRHGLISQLLKFMRHLNIKRLSILFFVFLGIASHAATVKKDTVYTHINSLLKTINTTKKQKATYYVTLTTKDNDSIKLRIDFRKLKANIPIYSSKNTHFVFYDIYSHPYMC